MAAKAEKATMSLGDKILQNAIAADAAIVILQRKLLKLLECKLIISKCLKEEIEDIQKGLDPLYEFLTKHPQPSDKKEWKSKLLEAVYNIEDGIDIFRSRIALQDPENVHQTIGIGRSNMFQILWAKCLLRRCLHEFKRNMKKLKDVEHVPDKLNHQGSIAKDTTLQIQDLTKWDDLFSHDISGKVMAGREFDMKKLSDVENASQDEEDKIRVIVGEQGFGKTFLARKFFVQQHGNFDCCAWVNVTEMTEPDTVLQRVQKQVWDFSSLMPHVQQRSMNSKESFCKALYGKRYLIVLDDVSNLRLLGNVVESLPDSNSGGCVLITTQDKTIGVYDPRVIVLKRLKDVECEGLVKSKWDIANKDFMELKEDSKKDFLNKCRGSPLRLNLLGGMIAKSAKSAEMIKMIPEGEDLDKLFAYCYNEMPGELKPCFLYMTLFPKSDSIPVRRLLRLWLSEGFLVVPKEAKMEPEDVGINYLKELMFRNLIEAVERKDDGSPRRVRVVTCLYNLFQLGAAGTELLYVNTGKETEEGQPQPATRLRWLVERSNIKGLRPSPGAKINHLRTFLSFYSREGMLTQDIGNFLKMTVSGKHFNLLTVLDLESVYKPNLDKVLGKLVLLKHLGLRSTALGSLPNSVADLPYLETLDLKYTNITKLPKSFWTKSRNLRHLYLSGCCRIDRDTFSSSFATGTTPFANLHTLSGAVVDNIQVKDAEGIAKQTIVGLSNMKKLTKLGIMFKYLKEHQNAIGDWISGLTNLQSLKLGIIGSSDDPKQSSDDFKQLSLTRHFSLSKLYLIGKFNQSSEYLIPPNLITLTLSGSNMNNGHILQLGDLPNLKVLNLKADSFTGDTLTFSEGRLQNLQVLRLWKLENMRILELNNKMPNIRIIEFRNCPKMKNIKHIKEVGAKQTVVLQLIEMQAAFGNEISKYEDKKIKVKKMKEIVQVEEDRVTKVKKNIKMLLWKAVSLMQSCLVE